MKLFFGGLFLFVCWILIKLYKIKRLHKQIKNGETGMRCTFWVGERKMKGCVIGFNNNKVKILYTDGSIFIRKLKDIA